MSLIDSETSSWYESRTIWAGVIGIAYGSLFHDYFVIGFGIIQIILRFLTKKEIEFVIPAMLKRGKP